MWFVTWYRNLNEAQHIIAYTTAVRTTLYTKSDTIILLKRLNLLETEPFS